MPGRPTAPLLIRSDAVVPTTLLAGETEPNRPICPFTQVAAPRLLDQFGELTTKLPSLNGTTPARLFPPPTLSLVLLPVRLFEEETSPTIPDKAFPSDTAPRPPVH